MRIGHCTRLRSRTWIGSSRKRAPAADVLGDRSAATQQACAYSSVTPQGAAGACRAWPQQSCRSAGTEARRFPLRWPGRMSSACSGRPRASTRRTSATVPLCCCSRCTACAPVRRADCAWRISIGSRRRSRCAVPSRDGHTGIRCPAASGMLWCATCEKRARPAVSVPCSSRSEPRFARLRPAECRLSSAIACGVWVSSRSPEDHTRYATHARSACWTKGCRLI